MKYKKKHSAVGAVVTVLSVASVMSPVVAYSTETDTAIVQQTEVEQIKKAPLIVVPQALNGKTVTKQEPVLKSKPQISTLGADVSKNIFSLPKADVVEINKMNFPDDTFRKYVIEFDRDHDQKLSASEIANVLTLYADGKNQKGAIESLKGIEYFTSLKTLYCYETQITELDVSKNTALVHLSCGDTPLLKLDVSENKALEYLSVANTKIKKLDVSNNFNLKELGCANTGIKEINIDKNTNLEKLFIRNTRITKLDTSQNKKLTHLDCAKTDITSLNVSNNPDLVQLFCDSLNINELDISNNHNLTDLWCNDTNIEKLDVSNCPALVSLDCYRTKLQNLDVSKNKELTILGCSQTPLKELNVTMLSKLESLYTWDTDINYLDVSQNPKLVYLDTPQTNLGYLDWGTNDLNELYMDSTSNINLTVEGDQFDITQTFKGIDVDKINMVSGGFLDKDSGIIKGYTVGTPIVYNYTCGISKGIMKILTVTLNLSKSTSKIEISGNLDMNFTGKPLENPIVKKTGSTGNVTFTYEMWNGNSWKLCANPPANVGIYRVTAHLAEDDFFEGAETTKEFTIAPKNVDNNNQIYIPDISSDKDVENLIIKDGDMLLVKGMDYEVERKQDGNKVTVTIAFKGNYTGTVTRTYTVNIDKPKDEPKNTGIVQTDDNTKTGLFITMSLLSVGFITFLTGKKRKQRIKNN